MPFTLAHPAAVIPLFRWVSSVGVPAGFVAGSIVPDLSYFLPLPVSQDQSHSLLGLLYVCLPLGVLTVVFFYVLLSRLIVEVCTTEIAARLPLHWRAGRLPEFSIVAVALSVVVGALTHVVWDSFTHADGLPVRAMQFMREPLTEIGGYTLYGYSILQHGSSLVGSMLLVCWVFKWYRSATVRKPLPVPPVAFRYGLCFLLFVPAFIVGVTSGFRGIWRSETTGILAILREFVGSAIYVSGTVALASVLIATLVVRVFWKEGEGAA